MSLSYRAALCATAGMSSFPTWHQTRKYNLWLWFTSDTTFLLRRLSTVWGCSWMACPMCAENRNQQPSSCITVLVSYNYMHVLVKTIQLHIRSPPDARTWQLIKKRQRSTLSGVCLFQYSSCIFIISSCLNTRHRYQRHQDITETYEKYRTFYWNVSSFT